MSLNFNPSKQKHDKQQIGMKDIFKFDHEFLLSTFPFKIFRNNYQQSLFKS
jgi:hypothetical protein